MSPSSAAKRRQPRGRGRRQQPRKRGKKRRVVVVKKVYNYYTPTLVVHGDNNFNGNCNIDIGTNAPNKIKRKRLCVGDIHVEGDYVGGDIDGMKTTNHHCHGSGYNIYGGAQECVYHEDDSVVQNSSPATERPTKRRRRRSTTGATTTASEHDDDTRAIDDDDSSRQQPPRRDEDDEPRAEDDEEVPVETPDDEIDHLQAYTDELQQAKNEGKLWAMNDEELRVELEELRAREEELQAELEELRARDDEEVEPDEMDQRQAELDELRVRGEELLAEADRRKKFEESIKNYVQNRGDYRYEDDWELLREQLYAKDDEIQRTKNLLASIDQHLRDPNMDDKEKIERLLDGFEILKSAGDV